MTLITHPDVTHADWRLTAEGPRLELVRRLPAPIERVWEALTTPSRLAAWMGVEWLGPEDPLSVGSRFDYRFIATDMQSLGRVLIFDPPRVFEHSWRENAPPRALIRWSLEPDGDSCVLTLTHRAGPPEDGPRAAAGWAGLIRSLACGLRGSPVPGDPMARWRTDRDAYAAAFPPEASRDGRQVRVDGAPALRFERRLAHPPAKVWSALTEPGSLTRWMHAEETVVEPWPGGRFRMTLGGGSSRLEGVIQRWDPPRALEYTWPERAARGQSVVRFEVFPEPGGSRLVLTHVFTAGLAGEADRADFASGWHWHLDVLETTLAGGAQAFDSALWAQLLAVYVVTL
jgi:uncharacterized protein YndB with AHSA1/START domain